MVHLHGDGGCDCQAIVSGVVTTWLYGKDYDWETEEKAGFIDECGEFREGVDRRADPTENHLNPLTSTLPGGLRVGEVGWLGGGRVGGGFWGEQDGDWRGQCGGGGVV